MITGIRVTPKEDGTWVKIWLRVLKFAHRRYYSDNPPDGRPPLPPNHVPCKCGDPRCAGVMS